MAASSFQDIINSETPVLIDFWADWCQPCHMLAPIIKELKNDLGDRLRVVKIDTEKHPKLSQKFNIKGIPTMILFKEGKLLWRQSGVLPKEEIRRQIEGFL